MGLEGSYRRLQDCLRDLHGTLLSMNRFAHDPFRLNHRPGPVPVKGDLPPLIRLVDDDDLENRGRNIWLRGVAAAVIAFFTLASVLTAAATTGTFSLLTDGWLGSQTTKR